MFWISHQKEDLVRETHTKSQCTWLCIQYHIFLVAVLRDLVVKVWVDRFPWTLRFLWKQIVAFMHLSENKVPNSILHLCVHCILVVGIKDCCKLRRFNYSPVHLCVWCLTLCVYVVNIYSINQSIPPSIAQSIHCFIHPSIHPPFQSFLRHVFKHSSFYYSLEVIKTHPIERKWWDMPVIFSRPRRWVGLLRSLCGGHQVYVWYWRTSGRVWSLWWTWRVLWTYQGKVSS